MTTNHDVSKLDDLIVTTIDSVRGYEHSAEHADAGRYAQFFADMAAERRQVVEALSARSRAEGGTPADYGSAAATIHRRWEDLRRVLGGGDKALLAEIERGEDYLKEEFDRVRKDDRMSPESLNVVEQCYQSVLRGHDRARALRDQFQAAD
ncbi:PA2169 family four-helix-bundle protein [Sphingomonas sp. S2-65]|uniref:PA2169 family four-helix-bundle protein n=1 Tax=Sphingomonas sp. S2-65 TaxID=2903960 RepID=UPI001F1EF40B|nr:PA2169 family four-helix-bundle protein [Sphingomonas sp. S2-65]UYY58756.1 PA2169 family four-helix-bundle protein [Sphingomonas sp. S2-65]